MSPGEPTDVDFSLFSGNAALESLVSLAVESTKNIDCLIDGKNIGSLAQMFNDRGLFKQFNLRRVVMRLVTEITSENLLLCKDLGRYIELLHSPGLIGSFFVFDHASYAGYIGAKEYGPKLIVVRNPSFVASQQFLLNMLVERAISAKQRAIEIARGSGSEFITTLTDATKIKSLVVELATSANYEIAVLFSTTQSFLAAEREGILEVLGKVSERGVQVKILVMYDEAVKNISDTKLRHPHFDVQINYLIQFLPTKITTVIVDQAKCMTIEVNDDTKESFQDSIGLATYSNSESTVFSNVSMFESLWIQAELDKQNKARQAYFKLFKGFQLKDEVYDRRWTHAQQESAKE
jgi:hypothetical protein